MNFKEFLLNNTLVESIPEYKIVPSHVNSEFFILIGQSGMVKIKLQLINFDEKKGYDAKLTFTGGEKIIKRIKCDYGVSAEELQSSYGDKIISSLLKDSKFKRVYGNDNSGFTL